MCSAVKVQSPNHWTTREFPLCALLQVTLGGKLLGSEFLGNPFLSGLVALSSLLFLCVREVGSIHQLRTGG